MRVSGIKVCVALTLFSSMLATIGAEASGERPITIIALGDSYLSGYGLAKTDGFTAQLEAALKAQGHSVTVINTGYHETTGHGLSWIGKPTNLQPQATPADHAVILELGSNDCLLSINVDKSRAYLDQTLAQLDKMNIPVLVVGTEAYDKCSEYFAGYDRIAYFEIFPELATKYGDLVYPSYKDGVTGHPELFQSDGDHPNKEGVAVVVARILPSVESLIARVEQP